MNSLPISESKPKPKPKIGKNSLWIRWWMVRQFGPLTSELLLVYSEPRL